MDFITDSLSDEENRLKRHQPRIDICEMGPGIPFNPVKNILLREGGLGRMCEICKEFPILSGEVRVNFHNNDFADTLRTIRWYQDGEWLIFIILTGIIRKMQLWNL